VRFRWPFLRWGGTKIATWAPWQWFTNQNYDRYFKLLAKNLFLCTFAKVKDLFRVMQPLATTLQSFVKSTLKFLNSTTSSPPGHRFVKSNTFIRYPFCKISDRCQPQVSRFTSLAVLVLHHVTIVSSCLNRIPLAFQPPPPLTRKSLEECRVRYSRDIIRGREKASQIL